MIERIIPQISLDAWGLHHHENSAAPASEITHEL